MIPMRDLLRAGLFAVAGLGLLAQAGCSEDTSPRISKFSATPTCGILEDISQPGGGTDRYMEVQFFGRASGGNELDDPTGANSALEWTWDFGDGTIARDVVQPVHRYRSAGAYTINVSVKDKDGDEDTASLEVIVGEAYGDLDVLSVSATASPPELVSVGGVQRYQVQFDGNLGTSCTINGAYNYYTWTWDFGDDSSVQHVGSPTHLYPATGGISYDAVVTVTDNALEVTRQDTVTISIP